VVAMCIRHAGIVFDAFQDRLSEDGHSLFEEEPPVAGAKA
jgi:hypothetical protein